MPPDDKIGAILIPDAAKTPPAAGWIVSTGPYIDDDRLKVGTPVIYGAYAGMPLFDQAAPPRSEAKYLVITEGDVIATTKEHKLPEGYDA